MSPPLIPNKIRLGFGLVVVALIGILATLVLIYFDNTWRRGLAETVPALDSIMEARVQTAEAHLWLEELLSGDATIREDLVWELLDKARNNLWMVKSGRVSLGRMSGQRPVDTEMWALLEELIRALDRFREIAQKRLAMRQESGIGTEIDQLFDQAFADMTKIIVRLDRLVHDRVGVVMEEQGLVRNILIATWLMIVVGSGWLIRRSEVRRDLAKRTLAESEERYRSLVEVLPNPVFVHTEGIIRFANPAAAEICRVASPEDLIGRPIWGFVPEDEMELAQKRSAEIEDKGTRAPLRQFTLELGGERKYIDSTGQRISYHDGPAVLTVWRDVTHRVLAEQERQELIDRLEDKNAELERFTYTVSHDLKSPLITIAGFSGLLEQDALAGDRDRIRSDVEHITTAANQMQGLLDELLELSRIGRLDNPHQRIDLNELVPEVIKLVTGPLTQAGAEVFIQPGLPAVFADRSRIVEVYQNLMENATKFMGAQESPEISIGWFDESGQPVLFVADNGQGIEPRYQEKIFGLFEQLDQNQAGTGIGLALVKRIIETHGGRLWVESGGRDKGSRFCFTLPQTEEGEDNGRDETER